MTDDKDDHYEEGDPSQVLLPLPQERVICSSKSLKKMYVLLWKVRDNKHFTRLRVDRVKPWID